MSNELLIVYIVIACIILYAVVVYLQDGKPVLICLVIAVLTLLVTLLTNYIPSIPRRSTGGSVDSSVSIEGHVSITPIHNPTAIPTPIPTATPNPIPTSTSSEHNSDEMVILRGGVQAPASDFLFPESINERLTSERLDQVLKEGARDKIEMSLRSQMAINEILARYGYKFKRQDTKSAEEAREKFSGKKWYQELQGKYPSDLNTLKENYFTEEEKVNYKKINDWQVDNEVDFYVGMDGIPFRD